MRTQIVQRTATVHEAVDSPVRPRLPELRRIPAPDHRMRLVQIGGMAQHKDFI